MKSKKIVFKSTTLLITLKKFCDINLRIKCDAIGLPAESFTTENVIKSRSELYGGFTKLLVDDQIIDRFYNEEKIFLSDASITVEAKSSEYPLPSFAIVLAVAGATSIKSDHLESDI